MSGFSDKHLKAAKIHAILMDDSSQKALLSRLEAAEKVIAESRRSWITTVHEMRAYMETTESRAAYEAWLLSKGGAGK